MGIRDLMSRFIGERSWADAGVEHRTAPLVHLAPPHADSAEDLAARPVTARPKPGDGRCPILWERSTRKTAGAPFRRAYRCVRLEASHRGDCLIQLSKKELVPMGEDRPEWERLEIAED